MPLGQVLRWFGVVLLQELPFPQDLVEVATVERLALHMMLSQARVEKAEEHGVLLVGIIKLLGWLQQLRLVMFHLMIAVTIWRDKPLVRDVSADGILGRLARPMAVVGAAAAVSTVSSIANQVQWEDQAVLLGSPKLDVTNTHFK